MIPESISAIYYLLGKKGWVFQIVLVLMAIIPFFPWMEKSDDDLQFLPFLSCGSLLFVAAAPAFKLRLDGMVHYSSAIVCGLSAVLWMFFQGCVIRFLCCLAVALILMLSYPKQYVFWLECAIIASAFSCIL